jgi:hypothetical protein
MSILRQGQEGRRDAILPVEPIPAAVGAFRPESRLEALEEKVFTIGFSDFSSLPDPRSSPAWETAAVCRWFHRVMRGLSGAVREDTVVTVAVDEEQVARPLQVKA